MQDKAYRLTLDACLAAVAMMLSFLETLLPLPLPLPGLRLGLCNVAVMLALFHIGVPDAACISLCRILLSWLLFGNLSGFLFSLGGGACSFLALWLMRRCGDAVSRPCASVAGAAAHMLGQSLVCALLYGSAVLFRYLPFLLLASIPLGALTGLLVLLVERRVPAVRLSPEVKR